MPNPAINVNVVLVLSSLLFMILPPHSFAQPSPPPPPPFPLPALCPLHILPHQNPTPTSAFPATTIMTTDANARLAAARAKAGAVTAYLSSRRKTYPTPTGFSVYVPRPTDVVVTTYPKAGTTLLQQLCYQVVAATGGTSDTSDPTGEEFVDICEKVPWLEYAPQMGVHTVESSPRVYKSHSRVEKFDVELQKHVVVVRNPLKFPGSWMEFVFDGLPQEIRKEADEDARRVLFDETVLQDLLGVEESSLHTAGAFGGKEETVDEDGMGAWLIHTKGWVDLLPHRNVLVLFYEDVVADLRGTARKVARFMGREINEEQTELVAKRCSREYMMKDDRFKSVLDEKVFGINFLSAKVKAADRDGFTKMSIRDKHVDALHAQMKKAIGVDGYEGLRELVARKQTQ